MKLITNYLLFVLLFSGCVGKIREPKTEKLIQELNSLLDSTNKYDLIKAHKIDSLKNQLRSTSEGDRQYELTRQIYAEYEISNFDSAFLYVSKLEQIGTRLKNREMVARARIRLSFILLSSGMFKESSETINSIDVTGLPDTIRAHYYLVQSRNYFNLTDYAAGSIYSEQYRKAGVAVLDSSISLYPKSSYGYYYSLALKNYKSNQMPEAKKYFDKLYESNTLSFKQRALIAATMSDVYEHLSQHERARELFIEAAIADMRAGTKEEAALLRLAEIAYKEGDYENASKWIERASVNANFYGSRLRMTEINPVMQVIDIAKTKSAEMEKKELLWITISVCLLASVLIIFSWIFKRQVRQLRAARASLLDVNSKLSEAVRENEIYIVRLRKNNTVLREAQRIKEEYISYFMNTDSDLFGKVERLIEGLKKKVSENKIQDVPYLINRFSLQNEKKNVLYNFDKVFLKIFPNFVEEFNSLFDAKDRITLREGEDMNTELRIFALIKMGITNSDKIAQVLEYSVNTIYAYKSKIKNKALVSNEEFEERMNQIVRVGEEDGLHMV